MHAGTARHCKVLPQTVIADLGRKGGGEAGTQVRARPVKHVPLFNAEPCGDFLGIWRVRWEGQDEGVPVDPVVGCGGPAGGGSDTIRDLMPLGDQMPRRAWSREGSSRWVSDSKGPKILRLR